MGRLFSLALVASLVAPVVAHADDDASAEPQSTLDPSASPTITDEDEAPMEIILRRLVKRKGNLVASPNFLIGRNPFMTPTGTVAVTGEALRAYVAAGFSDNVTAGAAYSMVLNDGVGGTDFTARGPLTLFVSYELLHKGPLDVVVGGDVVVDLAGRDSNNNVATHFIVRGGATARLTILDKVALYTGSPLAGTPQTHQLSIGLYSKARDTLSLPLGIAVQATPEVYTYLETNLADIYLANGPNDAMGNARSASVLFSDVTPVIVGAFYSLSRAMEAGASMQFGDLADAGYFVFSVGARFHSGP
jgi:hypothetical protein